jgi:hypothetical protein
MQESSTHTPTSLRRPIRTCWNPLEPIRTCWDMLGHIETGTTPPPPFYIFRICSQGVLTQRVKRLKIILQQFLRMPLQTADTSKYSPPTIPDCPFKFPHATVNFPFILILCSKNNENIEKVA